MAAKTLFDYQLSAADARALIAAGHDVNATDEMGRTPLIKRMHKSDPDAALAFIEAGSNVNALDNEGNSPLHSWVGEPAVAKALIERGADVNASNGKGDTPINNLMFNWTKAAEMIPHLVMAGADVNHRGSLGKRPVDKALLFNMEDPTSKKRIPNPEPLILLVEAGADTSGTSDPRMALAMIEGLKKGVQLCRERERREAIAVADTRAARAGELGQGKPMAVKLPARRENTECLTPTRPSRDRARS